ncbi:hypothetical protein [uncultured Bifidobacterium sp.]|uniref:hypothetical protein n=1 Tax=uncultured Bifidobacterium sp. TaxID=165187 RepID=UPI0025916391|nr:hypothetical protein [uncultured Bifidobacterium sp.]
MNTAALSFEPLTDLPDEDLTAEAATLDGVIPLLSDRIGDLARRNQHGECSPQETDLLDLLTTVIADCRERLHDISVEQRSRVVADPGETTPRECATPAAACDDDIADDEACTIPETTVFAYDAKQGRCRSFRFGGMLDTAAACAQANRDGYLTGLKDVRDLINGMIADHDEDTDGGDEACTDEGGV